MNDINRSARRADVPFAHDHSRSWFTKMIDRAWAETPKHERVMLDSLRCKECGQLFGCPHPLLDELPPWKKRRVERIRASL